MPQPLPLPIRQAMFRLWQQGRDATQIAASLDVSCASVYRMLERFRRDGASGIPPQYRYLADDAALPDAIQSAVDLRREHPTWGAEFIRMQLLQRDAKRPVPSGRTLQRWFARAGLMPPPAGRRSKAMVARATTPHDVWQMDAKEHIKLKHGEEASWLRIIDECSGAVLHTTVFPPRGLDESPP